MVAERITPEAIAAELDVIDGQAKRIAGDLVVSIGFTNAAVKDLAPHEWESVAAYLFALIGREPARSSPAYVGHRIVLGALASELRGFAAAAGEPVGLQADLRAAATQADEKRIRQRIADQQAAFDRHVDEVLLTQSVRREIDDHIPDEPMASDHGEEDAIEEPPTAAPPSEIDDALSWL